MNYTDVFAFAILASFLSAVLGAMLAQMGWRVFLAVIGVTASVIWALFYLAFKYGG